MYTELARSSLFSEPRGYSILGHVYRAAPEANNRDLRGGTDQRDLPSWVPDWRMRVDITPFKRTPGLHDDTLLYDASAGTERSVEIKSAQLKVKGFVFDSIEVVFDIWEDEKSEFDTPRAWGNCAHAYRSHISRDAIDRALVADLCGEPLDKAGDSRLPDIQLTRGGRIDWSLMAQTPMTDTAALVLHQKQDCMTRLLEAACFGRRMGVLQRNDIAIFPAAAKAGDFVAIFNGGHVPFVVREVSENFEYELIGECYLDGLMDGQAMDMSRKGGIDGALLTMV